MNTIPYVVYNSKCQSVQCHNWQNAVETAKDKVRHTSTKNGCVGPVSIWREGVCIAVVTDDANAVSIHRLYPTCPHWYQ